MYEMEPVWKFLGSLGGFEFTAFWVAFVTGSVIGGFVLDYVLQRQGFGPFVNALFIPIGMFTGLYVRYVYLRTYQFEYHEPYLTLGTILIAITILIVVSALVRNRLS